jgi:hypothetical protein
MTPTSPEDIISMFVAGLLREKRFQIASNDNADSYTINIETPSRNYGRVLGAQRSHLDDLITLGKRIDRNIMVVLLDPNEAAEKSNLPIMPPLVIVQAFLDFIAAHDVMVIEGDGGKTTITDDNGTLKWNVRNALSRLAFDIGRTARIHCEITWE